MTEEEIIEKFQGLSYDESVAMITVLKALGVEFEATRSSSGTIGIYESANRFRPILYIMKEPYIGKRSSYPVHSEGKVHRPQK